MPWISKEQLASVPTPPVDGEYHLIGDVVAETHKQDWLRGKAYPTISYPSGLIREHDRSPNTGRDGFVHLYGQLRLPVSVDTGFVALAASVAARVTGFSMAVKDQNRFAIWRSDMGGHYRINCTDGGQRIANIQYVDAEPMSQRYPRPMELLDGESRAVLPPLYHNEEAENDQVFAPVKFFTPDSDWTWYATEYDGDDLFFGLVSGFEVELGYFTLSELEGIRGPLGLPIERDLYYSPKSITELQTLHSR